MKVMGFGRIAEGTCMDPALLKARASFEALRTNDAEAYAACFTEDGGQEGPLGGRFQGQAELRRFHREFQTLFQTPRFEMERWFTRGLEAALVWSCRARAGERDLAFRGVSHWTHAPSGHIQRLQIHWNPSEDLGGDPGLPLPPLAPAWIEALTEGHPAAFASLLSPGVSLEGMASGGPLKGAPIAAQHLAHAVRQVGRPSFTLEGVYRGATGMALAWTGAVPDRIFHGVTFLESADGLRADRILLFWAAAED